MGRWADHSGGRRRNWASAPSSSTRCFTASQLILCLFADVNKQKSIEVNLFGPRLVWLHVHLLYMLHPHPLS